MKINSILVLLSSISIAATMNGKKSIPELSMMFQKVNIADLPGPKKGDFDPATTAWEKAMDAVKDKLESMNMSIGRFFSNIKYFQELMSESVTGQTPFNKKDAKTRSRILAALRDEYLRTEFRGEKKVGFGQKVKSFFGKRTNPSEEENMWELLRGALDLLKAKLELLKQEDADLRKQGK